MTAPVKTPRAASAAAAAPAFYDPETYKPDESIAFLMRRILNALAAEAERRFEPSGLTQAQWVPLLMLYMGRATMVAELARECQLDTGGMTRLLDRLEAKGLVRRVRSCADRRVVNLELTEQGRAAAKTIPAVLCGVQNASMRGFTVQEWQLLRQLLTRIFENASAFQAEHEAQP